ncbi:transglutaminase-like domain-containing protein [Microbacterium suwonense]|uniref:Cysteine protease n=1 Tax=Microbacterium suwonense TaxID=683047 RepID=A0ABN6X4J4_9MICO|nr:transglutaminase-like domain-containing protein [Microbacterium suwonense]BDZ39634.1 cysteine protease [Microbacterium suwonense]
MRRGWPLDVAAIGALTVLAVSPMASAFLSLDFWIAVAAGVIAGSALATVAARLRWRMLSIAALLVLVYVLLAPVVAFRDESILGAVPTLEVLRSMGLAIVQIWKQLLTMPAPFTGFPELTVGPLLLTMIVSTIGASLGLRARRPAFAMIPLAALLVLATAFSTYLGYFPAIAGALFAAVAVAWLVWRRSRAEAERTVALTADADAGARKGRPLAAVLATVAVLVAAVGGTAVASAASADREVLRDHVVPPLELHDYASPLMDYRRFVRGGDDLDLFTVRGLPAGASIRLATLDLYDGTVYKVTGGGSGSGLFARVGRTIENNTKGSRATVTVRIDDLTGVWLPTVGYLDVIVADSETPAEALHYNSVTGTAVQTTGVRKGETYRMEVVVPARPNDDELKRAGVADVSMPTPERVPDTLQPVLDDATADVGTQFEQLRALEQVFQSGAFSDGLENQAPSRSGHSIGRLDQLLGAQEMIGDDEQYAVAMALAATQLGIPARVVMGFTPASGEKSTTVTGADLHAWVEVPFNGLGWVAFSPTPPETNVPKMQAPEPRSKPRVQVAQPPAAPQEPAELPPAPPVEAAGHGDEPADLGWLWATLRISGFSLLGILVVAGPSIVLATLRGRRRRARVKSATAVGRVDGGWAELVDSAGDVGYALPAGATRREQSIALDERVPQAGSRSLAVRADAAVFGENPPSDADVESYWSDMEAARRLISRAMPWHRRLRARLFPRSVIGTLGRPRRRR